MRILMLSWEYPPVLVGGLGRHVHALARALAAAGHEVTVATRHGVHADGTPAAWDETVDGVRIVRAAEDPPLFPFRDELILQWTLAFNHALTRAGLHAVRSQDFDVIHAHDWLVTHAAVTLKHHLDLPLVATVHSTEAGRHRGWLPDETSRAIHSIEWWLTYAARTVITCSDHMKWEVNRLFDLPEDKTVVIPNGVNRAAFAPSSDPAAAPDSGARGPVIVSAGRLVYEKGIQDLIDATVLLRPRHPGVRVLIAGTGPESERLRDQARRLDLDDTVEFLGFVDSRELPELLGGADCFVIPSRYEPFGMVALEAAAAGTPIVAGHSGGLAEFIIDGETGVTHRPGDPRDLAEALSRVLDDPRLGERVRDGASRMIDESFSWGPITTRTVAEYERAETKEQAVTAAIADAELRVVIPEGNLLSG